LIEILIGVLLGILLGVWVVGLGGVLASVSRGGTGDFWEVAAAKVVRKVLG